ncbi:4-amino-4-deoxy-L-arabinose transferase [Noviherbaspirillum humi]|uniref:4-amino-4-deoxy-L-arabinose transferase n=1 Tax=Noviherbaspirillum humi TaxID=1688639 RepID=A0A239IZ25_9BURK|nr:glycosyltransferase [Noviherbaspirillum humi]SNS98809.1 4-amino-4-deoxy-L-arabinose transferase [Noviherbaspirillum humi]
MKPVRLPASATNALPRRMLYTLCLVYILSGLIGRDPWKADDAAGFGIMLTMAQGGLADWLWPNIAGLPMAEKGPLAFWLGALCIRAFGWLLGEPMAARLAPIGFFLVGALSVWYATYLLGRRPEAQPLRLAFGGQPEPRDYGRTLADGALLIYLGSLGLLLHSHSTSAEALYVSLVGLALFATARLVETPSARPALLLGLVLGLMTLTRGWVTPLALWLALFGLALARRHDNALRLGLLTLPAAIVVGASWPLLAQLLQPYGHSPYGAWMAWNLHLLALPSWEGLKYLLQNVLWFAWPAWPFAAWSVYAWRRQSSAPHIVVPLTFAVALLLLALLGRHSEESLMLPLLPPLAMLAAFGLPTMKRGAINAVDWFSVMTLTTCAAFIWIGWIAKQTGWPAQLARNAFKLAPGFKPEFGPIACLVAAAASIGWILLVRWRVSRRPTVLWRAVVLSSGGVILCWLLLTTLWMPWINYGKSYAGVSRQLAQNLPKSGYCVQSNVGPAQRASFAYFGDVNFAGIEQSQCDFLLLQDNNRRKDDLRRITQGGQDWTLLWSGRRPSDRDERYRLYQRVK